MPVHIFCAEITNEGLWHDDEGNLIQVGPALHQEFS